MEEPPKDQQPAGAQPLGEPAPASTPPPYQPSEQPPRPTEPVRTPPRDGRRGRGGFIWAAILIGAGIVFLLNNLGIIGWGVWLDILRFWPVILIAIGISIIFGGRSWLGAGLAALLVLAAIGAGVWLYTANYTVSAGPATTQEISQPLNGAASAEVDIRAGVAVLRIHSAQSPNQLIEGTIALNSGEDVSRNFEVTGNTGRFTLRSRNVPINWWFPSDWNTERAWDLGLNPNIPMILNVETGVGRAEIDLSQTHVTNLTLNTGVGETVVTLPGTGQLQARVQRGVGNVTIRVPQGMAARFRIDSGLGNIGVSSRFPKQGNEYVSPDFNTSPNRADVSISSGIGNLSVE